MRNDYCFVGGDVNSVKFAAGRLVTRGEGECCRVINNVQNLRALR